MKLRKFHASDAEQLAFNANEPEVALYLRDIFPSPYTFDNAHWWVTEGSKMENTYNLAIEVDGKCVGTIGVAFSDAEHRYTAELGYWIGKSFWGKGITTEAVNIFTIKVFENFQIRRIFAPVAHENIGSIAVLKKCGFLCEGIFKNNMYLRGQMYDEHIFAKYRLL